MIREIPRNGAPGIILLVLGILFVPATIYAFILAVQAQFIIGIVAVVAMVFVLALFFSGFFMVAPNEAKVLQLFGDYRGTARTPGLRWANPFYRKTGISLRVRNFETGHLKVNDLRGNPVEIAAIVVWKVVDSAEASFQVDNYTNYVHVQSEAALRNLTKIFEMSWPLMLLVPLINRRRLRLGDLIARTAVIEYDPSTYPPPPPAPPGGEESPPPAKPPDDE